jgi:hypothetical protein
MALSGTYTFSVVRDDIIREAMLNCGAIGEGEVPTAQEVTDCARKLNLMVKQWMGTQDFAPGLKMWTRARADLFLSTSKAQYALGPSGDNWAAGVTAIAGANYGTDQLIANAAAAATTLSLGVGSTSNFTANDYLVVQLNSGDIYSTTISSVNAGAGTIAIPSPGLPSAAGINNYIWNYTTKGQRPLSIVTAVLRDINNADTPLNQMTLQDYEILPTKAMTTFSGDPTAYYYESQFASGTTINSNGQLYLDIGSPNDVTKKIHMVCLKPVMDLTNANDNPEYPQQWYRALCWGLTREVCGMFDSAWTPDMDANYRESVAMARESDVETTSFYFQPNAGDPFSP